MFPLLLLFFKEFIHFLFKDFYNFHVVGLTIYFLVLQAILEYAGLAVVRQLDSNGDLLLLLIVF